MLGTYHLTALYDILKNLHFLYQSEKIYAYILENLIKTVDADSASLFVSDHKKQLLSLKACIGSKKDMFKLIADEVPFPYGKGICGCVAKFNQPVLVEDTQKDKWFNPQFDTLTGYKTRSVICAPISLGDEVLGAIEILNKKSSAFNQNDLDLLSVVARQAAIALENGRLYSELARAKNFSESVIDNLTGGFISTNVDGVITYFNSAAEKILTLSGQECVGQHCKNALKDYPFFLDGIIDTLKSGERKLRQEIECVKKDSTTARLGYSTFIVRDPLQKLLGAGVIFQDLTLLS